MNFSGQLAYSPLSNFSCTGIVACILSAASLNIAFHFHAPSSVFSLSKYLSGAHAVVSAKYLSISGTIVLRVWSIFQVSLGAHHFCALISAKRGFLMNLHRRSL